MEPGGRTAERLEMVAAKAGNDTLVVVVVVVEEIVLQIARIECLCLVYFHHHHLMLPHCHLGVVVSKRAHMLESCWLSLAEIHSSTSYVNTTWL